MYIVFPQIYQFFQRTTPHAHGKPESERSFSGKKTPGSKKLASIYMGLLHWLDVHGNSSRRVEICAACIHWSFCSTKMHLKNEFRMAEKIIRSNKSPLCHYDLLQSFQEIERWKTHPVAFFYVPSDETCHTTLRIPRRLPFWVKSVNIGNFGWWIPKNQVFCCSFPVCHLVDGIRTPLKNMSSSIGNISYIPNWMENRIHVPVTTNQIHHYWPSFTTIKCVCVCDPCYPKVIP